MSFSSKRAVPSTTRFSLLALSVLAFSYTPLLQLGSRYDVHIDISLIYVILLVVVLVSLPLVIRSYSQLLAMWPIRLLILLSTIMTISVLWSDNPFRGAVTAVFYWFITLLVGAYVHHSIKLTLRVHSS